MIDASGRLGRAYILRALLCVATFMVIAWWASSLLISAENAPRFSRLDNLQVKIPVGESVLLGRAELKQPSGARSAELNHILLRTTDDGDLLISRQAAERGLNLEFGNRTEEGSSDRYPILETPESTTELIVGIQSVRISVAPQGGLLISTGQVGSATKTDYVVDPDGVLFLPGRHPATKCGDNNFFRWLASSVKDVTLSKGAKTIVTLGGGYSCSLPAKALIAMPLADPRIEFQIRRNYSDGRLYISPYRGAGREPVSFKTYQAGTVQKEHNGISGMEWPVASLRDPNQISVSHFTAGRTRYGLSAQKLEGGGWEAIITANKRIPLFVESDCLGTGTDPIRLDESCPPVTKQANRGAASISTKVVNEPEPITRMFAFDGATTSFIVRFAAVGLGFLILYLAPPPLLTRIRRRWSAAAVAGICALLVIIIFSPEISNYALRDSYLNIQAKISLTSMIFLWILATIAVSTSVGGGWLIGIFWLSITIIISIGSISLFTLSIEGPNTDWERFFVKHKLMVLDILPFLVIILSMVSPNSLRIMIGNDLAGHRSIKSPFFLLIFIITFSFLSWFFIGNQQGIFGAFQPVEGGKFTIVVFMGMILSQWLIKARMIKILWSYWPKWISIFSLTFLSSLAFVPVMHSDYSPLIVICGTIIVAGSISSFYIGYRIREEERDDLSSIKNIPIPYIPAFRDKITTLNIFLYAICSAVYLIASTYLLFRNEYMLMMAISSLLIAIFVAGFIFKRVHRTLAFFACLAPFLIVCGGVLFSGMPVTLGLGAKTWSWSSPPDEQIDLLQDLLGEGRRLPIERLMSWADLRYAENSEADTRRALRLPDMDFHVMRSRAVLASSSCGLSEEMSKSMGIFYGPISSTASLVSGILGGGCAPSELEQKATECSPSNLRNAVRPHCVPVVQSDFAATYLVVRHGWLAAVLLILAQASVLLITVAAFLRLQSKRSRDPVATGADQAMAIIALGCAILFLIQWSLAWSNAFGLLPVMGQPMTWLSAATSHHLFMAIPAVLSILVSIRFSRLSETIPKLREPPRPPS